MLLSWQAAYEQVSRNYCPAVGPPLTDYMYVSVSTETIFVEVRAGNGCTRYRRLGSSSVGGST